MECYYYRYMLYIWVFLFSKLSISNHVTLCVQLIFTLTVLFDWQF
jgi:hypothetical protein